MYIDDFYEDLFQTYKKYIEENSSYGVRVVKMFNNDSPYFPITTFTLSNNTDTNRCTVDRIEYYEQFYFTIQHFAKNKTIEQTVDNKVVKTTVSAKVINDETRKLTITFMKKLNLKKTLDKPVQNLDKDILRNIMQYQCMVGNSRLDIIRR